MRSLIGLVLFLASANVGLAGFEFRMTGPLSGEYDTSLAGTGVSEDLYLIATAGDELSGLTGANFNITSDAFAGATTITGFTTNGAFTLFNNTSSFGNGFSVQLANIGLVGSGSFPGSGEDAVLLGTVDLLLGDVGSQTPINFTDPSGAVGDVFGAGVAGGTNFSSALDDPSGINVFPGSQIAAVPEPSALGMVAVLAGSVLSRRRRRS